MTAAPVQTAHPIAPSAGPPQTRSWAAAGFAAAVAGVVSMVAGSMVTAVYDADIAGDASAIAERLGDQIAQILVFHTATMVAALLLVVFAAGLRRRMAEALPADSLLPSVASSGLMLVAVAGVLGSGLTTEFVFGASDPDLMVPEAAAFFGHWVGTIPWLWGAIGLTAISVAAASLRHGAVAPRWLGRVSLVLGGLLTVIAVSPLQYMAGMVGPIWLLVASVALVRDGRR
jgi:hypothetical protein